MNVVAAPELDASMEDALRAEGIVRVGMRLRIPGKDALFGRAGATDRASTPIAPQPSKVAPGARPEMIPPKPAPPTVPMTAPVPVCARAARGDSDNTDSTSKPPSAK